jgi:imidazolonepropionase-like amidohydrolase
MKISPALARHAVQSSPSLRQRPGYCCPLHAVMGAFSPDRSGIRAILNVPDAAPPSLSDITPKERSRLCTLDNPATSGLYERLPPDRALVFRNARVLTMRGEHVLTAQDVIVRNGRIEAVRPTGTALPADAAIVEAAGKTLIPGLSDIHGHIFVGTWAASFAPMVESGGDGSQYLLPYDLQLFLQLACGITRVEVMAGCPDTLWMRDAVAAGTLAGPKLSVGSPLIDGNPVMHAPTMSYVVGDLEGGRRVGEIIAEMGFDFAKPYTNLPADGSEGLMQVCEKRGIRAMGHVPKAVGVEAAIRRGQQGIAHVAELFYNETGPERSDPVRRERLVRQMADAGTWLQATVVVCNRIEWTMGCTDRLVAPDRAHMSPLQQALWAEDSPMLTAIRRPELAHIAENAYELSCLATDAAREAGVRVLTGTDFPNPHVVEGFSLHEELMHFVTHCGFTPHEALFASTRRAAEYHGEGAADGTVAPGGRADLVLLDADPLADINATRRIHTVLAGSHLLRPEGIAEGWNRVKRAYDAMPPIKVQLPQQHPYVEKQE